MYTVHGYLPKEAIHQKRKNVIRQFLRNILSEKLTTDGIRKAPLPACLSAGGAKKRGQKIRGFHLRFL